MTTWCCRRTIILSANINFIIRVLCARNKCSTFIVNKPELSFQHNQHRAKLTDDLCRWWQQRLELHLQAAPGTSHSTWCTLSDAHDPQQKASDAGRDNNVSRSISLLTIWCVEDFFSVGWSMCTKIRVYTVDGKKKRKKEGEK